MVNWRLGESDSPIREFTKPPIVCLWCPSSRAVQPTSTIYWKEHKREDAIAAWRALLVDPADTYFIASSQILAELSAAPARPLNPRRINSILENENGRWVMASFDRLRKFGYRFDTY